MASCNTSYDFCIINDNSLAILFVVFWALKQICTVSDLFCSCRFLFMHLLNSEQLPRQQGSFSAESVRICYKWAIFFFLPYMSIWSVILFFGYYFLSSVRWNVSSFPSAVCVLFVFLLYFEDGISPNQSCCGLCMTYKYQPVTSLHAYPRTTEGLVVCAEDGLRLRFELGHSGSVRHGLSCSVAWSRIKGEGLKHKLPASQGRGSYFQLFWQLLFSWWSYPRLHSCTLVNLALSTGSQAPIREWAWWGPDAAPLWALDISTWLKINPSLLLADWPIYDCFTARFICCARWLIPVQLHNSLIWEVYGNLEFFSLRPFILFNIS